MRAIGEIIVHCAATRPEWAKYMSIDWVIREITNWHKARKPPFRTIGYHFVIDRMGKVGIGRPVGDQGAHVSGHNIGTIGICLLGGHGGHYDDKFSDHFTLAQERALRALIKDLRRDFPTINKVTGHNQYSNKACPCFFVPTWYIENEIVPPAKVKKPLSRWALFFQNLFSGFAKR